MISKRCPNCHKLFQGKACPVCSKKYAKANAKKRQDENEARKLYASALWKKVRKIIRIKYQDYDIWLLGAGQVYSCEKPYIHHIIERDENPNLIYNEDNLITVCKESHEEIHQWYKTDKKAAIERIQKGIVKFKELFADD